MALQGGAGEQELVNTFSARPATLQMGVGQWSPAIEQCLLGLEEGSAAEFALRAEQAYGVHNPELVRRLSPAQLREQTAPGTEFVVGEAVELNAIGALPVRGVLVQLDEQAAVVDFNHPLAGLPLQVRVQIIGVL